METTWRKSSRCEASGCVEVAEMGGMVLVRDAKHPDGPRLAFPGAAWRDFIAGVRNGEFDNN